MLVDVFVICSGPGAHNPNHDQLMKPVHVITGKNTKKQSVRQTEHNKKKTSVKIKKKKKNRHDTVGYENPETILWKKRVTYSYQLLCSQLAGRGARKLVIMKWLQTSYTVGILLITESYS